jgi:hypothetical protein
MVIYKRVELKKNYGLNKRALNIEVKQLGGFVLNGRILPSYMINYG